MLKRFPLNLVPQAIRKVQRVFRASSYHYSWSPVVPQTKTIDRTNPWFLTNVVCLGCTGLSFGLIGFVPGAPSLGPWYPDTTCLGLPVRTAEKRPGVVPGRSGAAVLWQSQTS